MSNDFLQLVNIGLTSGVLVLLIGIAVAYGKLVQKVDGHGDAINNLWKSYSKLEDRLYSEKQAHE